MKKKSRRSELRKSRKAKRRRQKRRNQASDVDFQKLEDRQLLASLTVSTVADVLDGDTSSISSLISSPGSDGSISLREAISAANNTAGADTVNLPAGTYTLTLAGQFENSNNTGDLDITDDLTIAGAGARTTTIDANGLDRVVEVTASASNVSISGVTIEGGNAVGSGLNEYGGGILLNAGFGSANNFSMSDSALQNNSATWGGGVVVWGGNATFEAVTLSGNSASFDAGIHGNQLQDITLSNSTVSGNTASLVGGGIGSNNGGTWNVTNTTITNNTAPNEGAGLRFQGNGLNANINNTIVIGNTGSSEFSTSVIQGENNLVDPSQAGEFANPGGQVTTTNALLGPLQDNSGHSDTHELLAGSPAIDTGSNSSAAALTNDQRGAGFDRVVNGSVDIGAFEFGAGVVAANYDFTSSSYTSSEGNVTTTTNVVTITRDNSSAAEDVDVVVTGGNATEGTDFTAGPYTVSFAVGETSKSVSIEILGDLTVEGDETINLSLTNFSGNGQVGSSLPTTVLTLENNDSAILSIANATVVETNSGTTQMVFNVSLSNPVSVDVSFDYTTVDGTAIAGQDYTATSGTLTIPAGQTSASISVDVNGDTTVELDEAFTLQPSNLQAGGLPVAQAQVGGTLSVLQSAADGNIFGNGHENIEVADLDGDGDLDAVTVGSAARIMLNDGTGIFSQSVLTDPINAVNTPQSVAVGDVDGDGDVDIMLTRGTNTPGTLFRNDGNANFTGEILAQADTQNAGDVQLTDIDGDGDLDAFVSSLSQGPGFGTVPEARILLNDGTGTFTNSGQALDDQRGEDVSIGDVDGDGDLDAVVATNFGGKIFLNDGSGNFTDSGNSLGSLHNIRVSLGDLDGDGDLDAVTTGRDFVDGIHLNDGTGNFSQSQTFGSTNAFRGNAHTLIDFDADGDLDVFRSSVNIGQQIYVNQGGSQQGTDGVFVAQDALFGSHNAISAGDLNGDGFVDLVAVGTFPSAGTGFRVYANLPTVVPASANLTNDDAATISIGDATVTEGGNLDFAVTLSQAVDVDTVITYSTVDGTSTAADNDFTSASAQTITIPAGQTSGTITVATGNDNTVELNETMSVDISAVDAGGRDVTLVDGSATGSIENDDSATIAVGDASVIEGNVAGDNSQLIFNVTLDNPVDVDVSLDFATQDVTADSNDYTGTNGTLTIAAGSTSGQIVVEITEDATVELDETVLLVADGLLDNNREITLAASGTLGGGGGTIGTFALGQNLGASNPRDVDLADIDGDGDLDGLVGDGTVSRFWINDGAGNFTLGQTIASTNGAGGVGLADFDGDGDVDAFLSRGGPQPDADEVWLNDGNGNFTNSGQSLGFEFSDDLIIADVDGDNDLDVITANRGGNSQTWINDGNANFTSGQSLPNSYSIVAQDFDGDSDLDLFVGQLNAGNLIFTNDGSGNFTDTGQSLGSGLTFGTVAGDFDGDGDIDVFANNNGTPGKIWLNDGSGVFSDSGQGLSTVGTLKAAGADVDLDGDLDLYTQNEANGGQDKIWLNDGNGIFVDSGVSLPAGISRGVDLGDLDGDGDVDVFVARQVWINQGNPLSGVTATGTINNDDAATVSIGDATVTEGGNLEFAVTLSQAVDVDTVITYSTVDGTATTVDGDYTGQTAQTLTIPAGQTSGTITVATGSDNSVEADESLTVNISSIDAGGRDVTVADGTADATITNDDSAVLSIANATVVETNSGTTQMVFNVSLNNPVSVDVSFDYTTVDGSAIAGQDYTATSGTLMIPAGQTTASISVDVNGDTTVELDEAFTLQPSNLQAGGLPVAQAQVGGTLSVLQSAADGNIFGNGHENIEVADLDGDGDLDAVTVGSAARIMLNDGTGIFSQSVLTDPINAVNTRQSVAVGDVDGDGDVDIMLTRGSNTSGTLFRNDGNANFTGEILAQADTQNSGDVELTDVDGDGDLDALVVSVSQTADFGNVPEARVLINDGTGTFTNSGQALDDNRGEDVSMGDVDGDGDLDAVVATNFGGKVFLNDGNGNFSDSGHSLGSLHNIRVSLGDLDGDGDLDAVTTGRDFVDGIHLNDGTGNFSQSQTFGSTNAFRGSAHALLDFDADGDLDVFRSSGNIGQQIYVNQGGSQQGTDGVFVAQDALFGSHNAISAGDLNGDGFVDLVAVGNFPSASTGFRVYANQPTVVPANGSITNDDSATISIGDATVTEGGNLEFAVTLSQAVDVDTVITYSTADGTATTADSDYTGQTAQTLTISAGQTSGTITVATSDDDAAESDETISVTLSAFDANGRALSFDTTSGTGTITNDDFAPVADAGGPYVISEGGGLTLDASGTTDADSTSLTFRWDVDGDGDFDENVTGANPTLTSAQADALGLNDDGTFNITVEASDGTNVDTATTTLTINNVDPDFDAGIDATLLPPVVGVFSRSLSFTDPGADSWTGTVDFGDGSGSEALTIDQINQTFDLNHTFTVDGTYTVTVTIQDDDGGTKVDTFEVNVQLNTAPVAFNDDVTIDEDSSIVIDVLADNGNGADSDAEGNINTGLTVNLTSPTAGSLVNNGDGTFTFNAAGAFESLATGQTDNVSFDYQIEDSFGETSTATVNITVTGANDDAFITGDHAGNMTEDDAGDAGVLNVADVDAGQAVFQAQAGTNGTYGDFSIDANGNWTYARTANLDSMNAGDVLTDSFTVTSSDGTATELVTVTINGVNDAAVITGDNAGNMNEDGAGDSGVLNVSDVDTGQAVFQAQTGTTGTYGDFSIDANGNWTYARTANLDSMNAGDVLTDSFNVVSADGTATETVSVTINGVNDGPVLTSLTLDAVVDDTFKTGSSETRRTVNLSTTGDAAVVGQKLVLTGTFDELDSLSSHTVTVDWGDGTVETFDINDVDLNDNGRSFELVHKYSSTDNFDINVTVDDGTATDVDSLNTTVANSSNQSGIFTVAGSEHSDVIKATRNQGNKIKIKVFRQSGVNSVYVENVANVSEISILGRGGHDYIAVSNAITLSTIIDGGAGHDVMFGGRGSDKMIGGLGNDIMIGRAGDDVMLGGAGHDWIKGNRGDDCIDGGAGNDLIAGGNGADTITGGDGYDVIWGQNSADWLYGNDGDDIIFGGNGNDNIFGGDGNDELWGNAGQDNIFGGDGNDWIMGGSGADMLIGEDGNDLVFGGDGADLIEGGEGNDLLLGGDGDDAIDGGAGDDLIFGGPGNDSLEGGGGMDIIFENFDWFWC